MGLLHQHIRITKTNSLFVIRICWVNLFIYLYLFKTLIACVHNELQYKTVK